MHYALRHQIKSNEENCENSPGKKTHAAGIIYRETTGKGNLKFCRRKFYLNVLENVLRKFLKTFQSGRPTCGLQGTLDRFQSLVLDFEKMGDM